MAGHREHSAQPNCHEVKGIFCFGETDSDMLSSADEPYVVMGIVSPNGSTSTRSQIFTGVDKREARPDNLQIYKGIPGGLGITVLLMEHDDEDPDRYKAALKIAVDKAALGLVELIKMIPDVGPVLSPIAGPIFSAVSPAIIKCTLTMLSVQQRTDRIDTQVLALSAKDMVVLAGQAPLLHFEGNRFQD